MAAAKSCSSERWRLEGNQEYAAAGKQGLAPIIRRKRFEHAIFCYNNAMKEASSCDLKASASKNLAKTAWQIYQIADINSAQGYKEMLYYFGETMKHFALARKVGASVKTREWQDDVSKSQEECFSTAMEVLSGYPPEKRLGAMEQYAEHLEQPHHLVECNLAMAQLLFRNAVKALEQKDFKTSLHNLKECYRPIEEMKKHGKDSDSVMSEVNVISGDVQMHTASAESLQAIITGDELLQKVLLNSEELNMPLVMDVLDWYTQAIILSRNIEIEREAVASSRIGKVYDQILKMPSRAKVHFTHAISLAHSLAPRVFLLEDWFQVARTALDKYQQESVAEQEKREEEERKKHLKDLQKELKQLRDFQMNKDFDTHYQLLLDVYNTFPPKNTEHKLPQEKVLKTMSKTELKKVFFNACVHYHPDKQDVDKYGKGWKFFAGEITKIMTNVYEQYKAY